VADGAPSGAAVAAWAATVLGTEQLEWAPLPADAGSRIYVRLRAADGRTWLAMILRDRGTDYLAGPDDSNAEVAFLTIGTFLRERSWPVPQILHCDRHRDWLIVEDLGDVRLQDAIESTAAVECRALYLQAVRLLIELQRHTADARLRGSIAARRALDVPTLAWELWHCAEWAIEAHRGVHIEADADAQLRAEFLRLAVEIGTAPMVLAHRDYQSRNIMVVTDGSLRVIDFQDAAMANPAYDLASLLADSYVELDCELIDDCVEEFHRLSIRTGTVSQDLTAFRRLFDIQALQRTLKVAGRFVWLARVAGQHDRIGMLGPVLARAATLLARHDDLAPLARMLVAHGFWDAPPAAFSAVR